MTSAPPTDTETLEASLSRLDCPVEILAQAPKFAGVHLQRMAAAHPSTPQDVLEILFDSRHHWSVRHAVLSRPDLPDPIARAVVMAWQADDSPDLRTRDDGTSIVVATHAPSDLACLAANPAAPTHVLFDLAGSLLPMVQVEVARNPSTPNTAILRLLHSDDEIVVGAAAANPSIPPEALVAWLRDEERPAWIAYRAATNPACPPEVADEVLTWMAIGGYSGNSAFDPESMFGSPNSTGLDAAWLASKTGEAWQLSALPRIRALQHGSTGPMAASQRTAALLAQDHNPLVRQGVLRLHPLQQSVLQILVDDPDPAIAKVARLRLDASVREQRGSKESLPWVLRTAAACVAGALVVGLGKQVLGGSDPKPLVLPTGLTIDVSTAPSTLQAATPTSVDPIQVRYIDTEIGRLPASELAVVGTHVSTPAGSGLSAEIVWQRDGDRLRVLLGVADRPATDDAGSSAAPSIRAIEAVLALAGAQDQSKRFAVDVGEAALLDVWVEPAATGTFTVRSTDGLAPISITCDVSGDCVVT